LCSIIPNVFFAVRNAVLFAAAALAAFAFCSCEGDAGYAAAKPAFANPAARPIRVLLSEGKSAEVSSQSGANVSSSSGAEVSRGVSGTLKFEASSGKVKYKGGLSDEFTVVPAGGGFLVWNGSPYRGMIRVKSGGKGVMVINVLDVDEYLRGVVPAEVPYTWPMESIKAQAVAARTYAVSRMIAKETNSWDVVATTADQVYNGVKAEHPETDAAVAQTAGEIAIYEGKPIIAYYHADSGGFTKQGSAPYLKPVPSPAPNSPYSTWEVSWTPDELRAVLDAAKLPGGEILGIDAPVDETGRCVGVTITTSKASFGMTAHEFRKIAGISTVKSTMFDLKFEGGIAWDKETPFAGHQKLSLQGKFKSGERKVRETYVSGKSTIKPAPKQMTALGQRFKPARIVLRGSGYGHGTGMSQWGAMYMASQGKNYLDILLHYYTGVSIVKMEDVME